MFRFPFEALPRENVIIGVTAMATHFRMSEKVDRDYGDQRKAEQRHTSRESMLCDGAESRAWSAQRRSFEALAGLAQIGV